MDFTRVYISTTTPVGHADKLREAIGKTGAGVVGDYTFCSFSYTGTGRFIPGNNTKPFLGKAGELEVVDEEKVEVVCDRSKAKAVIKAIKESHPYEEPIFNIIPLIDENQL